MTQKLWFRPDLYRVYTCRFDN